MFENLPTSAHGPIVWPLLIDYSKNDCERMLRNLELEAYAKVIAVFRAQGPLTMEKRKTLEDLQHLLSIATDRHKAEIRRALNDERLATIAESICGKETAEDWAIEARRVAPVFLRNPPKTVYLAKADSIAAKWAALSHTLPRPCATAVKSEKKSAKHEFDDVPRSNDTIPPSLNGSEVLNVHDGSAEEIVEQHNKAADVVPEAAVEVTCKADATKQVHTPLKLLEKTVLVNSVFANEETVSTFNQPQTDQAFSEASKMDAESLSQENVCALPTRFNLINASIPISKSAISSANVADARIISETTNQHLITPTVISENSVHLNNGVAPLISQSRSLFIRQNVLPSTANSSHGSPAVHDTTGYILSRILKGKAKPRSSINSITGVHQHVKANASILSSVTTTLSRLAPTTPADGVTAPQPLTGITTMVVTGSSGAAPAAYVSGQTPTFNVSSTAAKRIMMNYNTLPAPTTTVVYNHQSPMALPSVGTTAHLSASSILADSKKQHQLLQHQPATQLAAAAIIQQQPQSAAAAAGNVFVVHRTGSNHLMTTGSAVAAAAHLTYAPATLGAVNRLSAASGGATSAIATNPTAISPASRPVRILSYPLSSIVPPSSHNSTVSNAATLSTVSSASQQPLQQQHFRVPSSTANIATIRSDSDMTVSPSGSLKIIKMPLLANHPLLRTAVTSPATVSVTSVGGASATMPAQSSTSPALVSILEPKRPRLAFVPSPPATVATAAAATASSPSARQ